ncbi:high choriolytic enzyme 1-like [Engraulis encrasicolus]|uniref:high choriolytic enzyme 1-like n=1 Tax=Engraulis encrasicolus TaxID=184585 RepID=UPI002FD5A2A4
MASSTALLLTCLLVVLPPAWCHPLVEVARNDKPVSEVIEEANKHLGEHPAGPQLVEGDIAVPAGLTNAARCTSTSSWFSCKWPTYRDGLVYVPYVISPAYGYNELWLINKAMKSFEQTTCILFIPRQHNQRDFLYIMSDNGCYSSVGRQGGGQVVSLQRGACVYLGTVQHELLHALGFQHEQNRSDRDQHVKILWQNIVPGKEQNFQKADTNNLGTPYSYGSVMHYGREFFSRNGKPTIVPIPDPNVEIGKATAMSELDIRRINLLYCRK